MRFFDELVDEIAETRKCDGDLTAVVMIFAYSVAILAMFMIVGFALTGAIFLWFVNVWAAAATTALLFCLALVIKFVWFVTEPEDEN